MKEPAMSDAPPAIRSGTEYLLLALQRLEVMLRRQVLRLRAAHQLVENEYRGLYIPDEQVDALLRQHAPAGDANTAVLTAQIARMRAAEGELLADPDLPFARLRRWFGLRDEEIDLLLIALAPEVDSRYETLYAYVQNDVARRRPSLDLALKLLYPDLRAQLDGAARLSPDGPLLRHGLLRLQPDPANTHDGAAPPRLAHYLAVDARIAAFLLGRDELDERLRPFTQLHAPHAARHDWPPALRAQLRQAAGYLARRPGLVCLVGPYGTGKRDVAAAVSAAAGLELVAADLRLALRAAQPLPRALHLLQQEARLQGAALYLAPFDLIREEPRLADEFWAAIAAADAASETACTIFLGDSAPAYPREAWPARPLFLLTLSLPDASQREQLWRTALNGHQSIAGDVAAVAAVAHKFRLSPGQIADAARLTAVRAEIEQRPIAAADLHSAARARSNQALRDLAQKLEPKYRWDDIILPRHVLGQLRDVYHALKFRHVVYGQWGFDGKLALGKGLNVLFSGPSGVGKTMAADILAHELGLDIYKIDLSTVVSKYIGETEKNLSRVFSAAQASNAILFFDEADALFGKRSEVKDARDRYANIEVAYLLQKMEEYDGMSILATNLSGNMDDAFARRLHHAIEFPFPDKALREQIWRRVFPAAAPLADDVDFPFLARQFELSGGNIRNVALAAAFMAAEKGTAVSMSLLVLGVARELQKMNRLPARADFRDYYALVREQG
jgi:SpoVK/Ycf46/Vps4 family AAA+-type ATPase